MGPLPLSGGSSVGGNLKGKLALFTALATVGALAFTAVPVGAGTPPPPGTGKVGTCPISGQISIKPGLVSGGTLPTTTKIKTKPVKGTVPPCPGATGDGLDVAQRAVVRRVVGRNQRLRNAHWSATVEPRAHGEVEDEEGRREQEDRAVDHHDHDANWWRRGNACRPRTVRRDGHRHRGLVRGRRGVVDRDHRPRSHRDRRRVRCQGSQEDHVRCEGQQGRRPDRQRLRPRSASRPVARTESNPFTDAEGAGLRSRPFSRAAEPLEK